MSGKTRGHTPGPWRVDAPLNFRGDALRGDFIIREPSGGRIAHVPGSEKADAFLIAASPDLLEALIDLRAAYSSLRKRAGYDDGDESDSLALSAAAIAKATEPSL